MTGQTVFLYSGDCHCDEPQMSLYNDISPETMKIVGIAVAAILVIVVFVVLRDIRILRKGREDVDRRMRRLRLSDMIDRCKIKREKYFRKTSDLDRERHIWACEHCPEPEVCEHMFEGEDIDPHTFCPNID